jgi:hypothetical protein
LRYNNFSHEAYKAIEKATNVVICPNQPNASEDMEKLSFPNFLYDALMWAVESKTSFLYADETMLPFISYMGITSVEVISITALLRNHNNQNQASDSRYDLLLSDYQFINFTHTDIYRVLSLNSFEVEKSNIEPFFRCKSYHDMDSYGAVYARLLRQLIEESRTQCAIDFSRYVFSFLDKTKKRSFHCWN